MSLSAQIRKLASRKQENGISGRKLWRQWGRFCSARVLWQQRHRILIGIYMLFVGFAFGGIILTLSRESSEKTDPPVVAQKNSSDPVTYPFTYEEGHAEVEAVVSLPPSYSPLSSPFPLQPEQEQDREHPSVREQPTWEKNAVRPVGLVTGQPVIAIVIDDLGIRKNNTRQIIDLDPRLTLAFLPYATELRHQTALARRRGHELMIHMPMQPKGAASPGPQALESRLSEEELLSRLDYNLSQFEGYVGINNHMGSAFTEDEAAVAAVVGRLKKEGLLVLDSRTTSRSRLAEQAARKGVPHVSRDVFLDNRQDVDYILGQLDKLEDYAHCHGIAVGIGHPYGETIEALKRWLPTLEQKGIALVPLSHVVREKARRNLLVHNRTDILAE